MLDLLVLLVIVGLFSFLVGLFGNLLSNNEKLERIFLVISCIGALVLMLTILVLYVYASLFI